MRTTKIKKYWIKTIDSIFKKKLTYGDTHITLYKLNINNLNIITVNYNTLHDQIASDRLFINKQLIVLIISLSFFTSITKL